MKRYLIFFILVILSTAVMAYSVNATTINVCHCLCSCDFTSIQKAVYKARRGDVIEIAGGTYHENLVIDKSITLKGPKLRRAVVESLNASQPVVVVGPSEIKANLENLVITRKTSSKPKETSVKEFSAGIMVIGEGSVSIKDTVIEMNY